MFSDDGGVSHWDLGWPTHAWKRYATKAGVLGVRLHDLRHTAASQMLMAGVPLSVVAERLGCTEGSILRDLPALHPGFGPRTQPSSWTGCSATLRSPQRADVRRRVLLAGSNIAVDELFERALGDQLLAVDVRHSIEHTACRMSRLTVSGETCRIAAACATVYTSGCGSESRSRYGSRRSSIARVTAASTSCSMVPVAECDGWCRAEAGPTVRVR